MVKLSFLRGEEINYQANLPTPALQVGRLSDGNRCPWGLALRPLHLNKTSN
jgi:hypothetical protein